MHVGHSFEKSNTVTQQEKKNKPKMAYSRDAFIRELLKGLERETGETGGILEIDWREAYHRLIFNCI